jgi:DtxR family Mn-dependent transcriptional regulator
MTKTAQTVSEGDYLKAILAGSVTGAGVATRTVARLLAVSAPSVTNMFKRLAERGLVEYSRYEGVRLTTSGRKAALRLLRRHRLIELFLFECLGMSWAEIHEEAEVLEHAISDRLEQRLDDYLGNPTHDPHGAPIPDRNGVLPRRKLAPLSELAVGAVAEVAQITDESSDLLIYLSRRGIRPGRKFKLLEKGSFGGDLRLQIESRNVHLSIKAAERVLITAVTGRIEK